MDCKFTKKIQNLLKDEISKDSNIDKFKNRLSDAISFDKAMYGLSKEDKLSHNEYENFESILKKYTKINDTKSSNGIDKHLHSKQ